MKVIYLGSNEKKFRKRLKKIEAREAENAQFEDKATKMLKY